MTQAVPLLTIKMVKPGVELVLAGLNHLPRGQVEGLYREIEAQANLQLEMMQIAAAKQEEIINNPPEQPPQPEEE